MKKQYYIGLDVHKNSIAIAYTYAGSRSEPIYYGTCGGSNLTCERKLRKLAKDLGVKFQELQVCYEAGPTGFVLARHLNGLGVECILCSPSKTEGAKDKIKTDKRDAIKLAKLFKNGDLVEVRIPPAMDEAVRDLCRARTDATEALSVAKKQLLSFLLRNGYRWTGKSNWTPSHMNYLRNLKMQSKPHELVLEEYIQAVDAAHAKVERMKQQMIAILEEWEWKPVVRSLMGFKGFQEVAAMTLISELGDLKRFSNPRKLMAFLGLVPSEESSGGKRRQGSITKCGNGHARWMLIECAQHYRKKPKVGAALSKRQTGLRQDVKDLSWRAQNRLSARYVKLRMRKKRETKIIVTIARELVGFLWELQNKCKLPIPQYQEEVLMSS